MLYVSLRRIFSRKSVACGATPFLPKRPLPPPKKHTAPAALARGEAPIGLLQVKDFSSEYVCCLFTFALIGDRQF